MRKRERDQWIALLAEERDAHRKERQELLNRIASPERVIVDPVPHEPVEPSRDTEELAYVGQIVPDTFRFPEEPDGE